MPPEPKALWSMSGDDEALFNDTILVVRRWLLIGVCLPGWIGHDT